MTQITFTLSSLKAINTLYTDTNGVELKISQPTLRVWFEPKKNEVTIMKFLVPIEGGKAAWIITNQYYVK